MLIKNYRLANYMSILLSFGNSCPRDSMNCVEVAILSLILVLFEWIAVALEISWGAGAKKL